MPQHDDARVRPFYCGTQMGDWTARNCERCVKGWRHEHGSDIRCDIDGAIAVGYIGDGTVSAEIARRMGYVKESPPAYTWDCLERELTSKQKEIAP